MNRETDEEYDRRQHAVYWARENKRAAAEEMYTALQFAKSELEQLGATRAALDYVQAIIDKAAPAVTEDELEGK